MVQEEYDRNDHATSREALECMVRILMRTGQDAAGRKLILESQFESLKGSVLDAVLDGFENHETEELTLGLGHPNSLVRLRTLHVLSRAGSIDRKSVEELLEDSEASVRNEAITALSEMGRTFTEVEMERVLVRPRRRDSV